MDATGHFDVRRVDEPDETAQHTALVNPAPAGMLEIRRSRLKPPASLSEIVAITLALVAYLAFFFLGVLALCLLEIRQANVSAFTSLVSTLEERDRFEDADNGLRAVLLGLVEQRASYSQFLQTIDCSKPDMFDRNNGALFSFDAVAAGKNISDIQNTEAPASCERLRETVKDHLRAIVAEEDATRFKIANLGLWYHGYVDGITQQAPQIIPILSLLKAVPELRSPFEIVEMTLLICAGVLGGVISVIRFVIDPSEPKPSSGEFIWRPATGALIAFGTFILFRAGQLMLGAQPQDGGGTASTSMFLLALVGLVSGLCAKDAIAQIEKTSASILRRKPSDSAEIAGREQHSS